jgi:hypothetical protein
LLRPGGDVVGVPTAVDDRDFVDEVTGRVAIAMKGVPICGCGC